MGFHILVSLQSCQDNYVGVYVQCSGYELGHYFLLLIHAEENPAVLSIQVCISAVIRLHRFQTPGPPKPHAFCHSA